MTADSYRAHRSHLAPRRNTWIPRVLSHARSSDVWDVVERHRSGVLRYARARGTMALPITYVAWDRRLYFRLPEYNDACHFLDRADLALDVDASSIGRALTVRITGLGLMVGESEAPADAVDLLEAWPGDVTTRLVVLIPEHARTTSMSDDARHPPLPPPNHRLPGTFADS